MTLDAWTPHARAPSLNMCAGAQVLTTCARAGDKRFDPVRSAVHPFRNALSVLAYTVHIEALTMLVEEGR